MKQAVPSFLLLPFRFDSAALERDLAIAEKYQWPSHYNSQDYEGGWTSLSLRSQNGDMQNVYATPHQEFLDTPLLAECSYFAEVMEMFRCEKQTVRLLCLQPGSVIKAHRDQGLSYPEGEFRLHVPILTSAEVEFMVDGEFLEMKPGECWYADFTKLHSVANRGKTRRVHLVLDCVRNDWTDGLFAAEGYDVHQMPAPTVRKAHEIKEMIIAYRSSGHPALLEQAELLEEELKQIGKLPS